MSQKRWERFKKLSSWRKISFGMWDPPDDPTIYGAETLDVTDTLPYLEEVSEAAGQKITLTTLIAASLARTLKENPTLNVIIVGPHIHQRNSVDIFCQVAVASREPSSADLSGVKLRHADAMNFVDIARVLSGGARKLRAGQDEEMEKTKGQLRFIPPRFMRPALKLVDFLTYSVPIDLDKLGIRSDPFGSAMVTSVSQFGIKQGFAPMVPMAHCSMVLLPGCVHDAPLVIDGEVKARKVITISATFDHRAYDGLQIGYVVRAMRKYITHAREHWPAPETFGEGAAAGDDRGGVSRTPEANRASR